MSHPRRAFVSLNLPDPIGAQVQLEENDSDHFRKVLRLREGDLVTVVDQSKELAYEARILKTAKLIEVEIISKRNEQPYKSPVKTLACALLKSDHNDLVAEKATELGVENIYFFAAERSVLKIKDSNKAHKKLERWRNIAKSSARQSIKLFCPEVELFSSLPELLSSLGDSALLYGSLENDSQKLIEISSKTSFPCCVLIGPEGDFSDSEFNQLRKASALGFSLGPYVLRAETAAICAISALSTLSQLAPKQ